MDVRKQNGLPMPVAYRMRQGKPFVGDAHRASRNDRQLQDAQCASPTNKIQGDSL